jgi:hypothetical protein
MPRSWLLALSILASASLAVASTAGPGLRMLCPADYGSYAAQLADLGPFVLNGHMPSNARIFAWLADYDPSTVRLVRDEREIPVVVEPAAVDVPGAYWVSPTELLVSPGLYTISVSGPPAYAYETYFGSSGSLDNSAPLAGEARVLPIASHAYCEEIVGTNFYLNIPAEYGTTLVFEVELFRAGEAVDCLTRRVFERRPLGMFDESHVEDWW